jgi:CheY-like chemotaxis protein
MSFRRLLLIDSDPAFHRMLYEHLAPYGFEIYVVETSDDPLSEVREVGPEIIFIAVEVPDKIGYSLCNRAKKGVARDIPVVLTTSSVPASGFNSHRKLKVHADEYIDKRVMTTDEVIQKVDALVGLGAPVVAPNAGRGVELAEAAVESAANAFADARARRDSDFEDAESTHIATPGFLNQLEAETDAAFAALGVEDPAPAALTDDPAFDSPLPSGQERERATDVHMAIEPSTLDEGLETDVRDARVADLAPLPEELAPSLDDVAEWAHDAPTVAPSSGAEQVELARAAQRAGASADPTSQAQAVDELAQPSGSEDEVEMIDLDDLEIDDDIFADEEEDAAGEGPVTQAAPELSDVIDVAEAPAPQIDEPAPQIDEPAPQVAEPAPEAANAPAIEPPDEAPVEPPVEPPDEAPVEPPVAPPDEGPVEPAVEPKSESHGGGLDLGLDDVAELAHSEQTGEVESGAQVARLEELEREVERLREENQRLQKSGQTESPYSREREFLNLREVINKKEREVLNLQDELGGRERDILEAKEKLRKLERDRADVDARALELEQKLLEAHETISTLEDEKTGARERVKRLEGELYEARGKIDSLSEEHPRALEAQKRELEGAHAAALDEERGRHEREQAQAAEAHQQALTQAAAEKTQALDALANEHEQAVAAREQEHRAQLESLEDRHAGQLARLERESKEALEEAARARAAAEEAMKSEFAAERDELGAKLASERSTIERLESELQQAGQRLEERDATVAALREQIQELEDQGRSLQEQVLRAHERIERDEETVVRARKALSVALTILDDSGGPARAPADEE